MLEYVLDPGKHGDGAGQPQGPGRKGDYLLDLLGADSHGEGFSHVRTNGPFSLSTDGDGEFQESTSPGIRRPLSTRQGKHLPGLCDLGVPLDEILICVGWPRFHQSLEFVPVS